MEKIKAVVFDVTGNALKWLDQFGDEDHLELCEVITLEDDSPMPISDLPLYDNWDILLVFENGVRDQIDTLLSKLNIPRERVIYPMDIETEDVVLSSYIFRGPVRRLLRYFSYRLEDYKYALSSAEGLTYINAASDNYILPGMIFEQSNWAKDEMVNFCRMAKEYYTFTDDQVLFCDIGANIGTTCIYFKKKLDADVKILAFEPSPQNYRLLTVNAVLNELDETDYTFVRKGLSDKSSTAAFNYDPDNPGGSSIVSEEDRDHETVGLVTLEDYFESNGLDPGKIKYIWIDVEGFEARFLAGARNILSQIDVPIIMEFTPQFYAKKDGEFELLMNELKSIFTGFICMQDLASGKMPIDSLWREQNNMDLQCDLFLLK